MFGQALKRSVVAAGAAGAMVIGLGVSPASALVLNAPFTWFPGGAIPPLASQPSFTADNITVKDFAKITIQNGGGAGSNGSFTETGILQITAFSNNGGGLGVISTPGLNGPATASPPGSRTSYKLYFVFSATGILNNWASTGVGLATAGNTYAGSFTTLHYDFYGDPGGNTSLGNVGGVPTVGPTNNLASLGFPADLLLGSGDLFGTCAVCTNLVTLSFSNSNKPLPAAQVSETFDNVLAQTGPTNFFQAPSITLDLEDAFTNTGVGQVSLAPCVVIGPATSCNGVLINGGGGSADFFAIPEPGSLLLLGTGLVGWAGVSRRRRRARA